MAASPHAKARRPLGAHLIHLLDWQMRKFRPREMRCLAPTPPAGSCGRPRVGSQASWHPVQSFSLPSIFSLFGREHRLLCCVYACTCVLCICVYVYVCMCLLLGIFQKASTNRASSPIFKEPFCEKSGPGCPTVIFLFSPEDCFALAGVGRGVEMGDICLVFNVWCL